MERATLAPSLAKRYCIINPPLTNDGYILRQVLMPCYSTFQLERAEFANGRHIITLALNDYLSGRASL
jgi:hypothetical protein